VKKSFKQRRKKAQSPNCQKGKGKEKKIDRLTDREKRREFLERNNKQQPTPLCVFFFFILF